jgi:hypothetical protein
MRETLLTLAFLFSIVAVGCDGGPKSARGFSLPDGNMERGRAAFVELQCNTCHKVSGIDQVVSEDEPEFTVALGGEVNRIKTYGELVTSIINPSHRLAKGYSAEFVQTDDGESKMKNYNDVMTVSQLIDLVAFLQSRYTLIEYERTIYPHYY